MTDAVAPSAPAGSGETATTRRVAVVGISVNRYCGVRDHARLLTQELERRGASCSVSWLTREARGLRPSPAEVRAFSRRLAQELAHEQPDAIVLHYSVFSYCYRGFPMFLRPVLAAIGRTDRLVTIGHELAYPWHHAGLRGKLWALAQRPAAVELVRASSVIVVTADFRAQWVSGRWWLPRRPVRVAPVFSNLPAPRALDAGEIERDVVGMFGYAYGGVAKEAVLDAARLLRDRGLPVRLRLLGAPGGDSPSARQWREQARARGIERELSFSGALPPQELADALARCGVLLFADTNGPSSRKTTLASSLASGRPLVTIDGRLRWRLFVDAEVARVVAPTPQSLADALGELLGNAAAADELGARGRAFAEREMSVGATAAIVESALALRA
jgi:glycosyltransferase involved in cell wall biosynthesis